VRRSTFEAVTLAIVAGIADAVGYLSMGGVFAANMTGNTVLAGIAVAAVLLTRTPMTTVPNVVGQPFATAQRKLDGASLNSSFDTVQSTKPANQVIAQNPGGGSSVKEHTTVTLQVSAGPGTISVPAVDGDNYATAKAALENAGLVVARRIDTASTSVDRGIVIKTSPSAGTNVDRGSNVNVYVSTGPPQATVPNTVGESAAVARTTLVNAGFEVDQETQESTTVTAGNVISQTPAGGTSATRGALVTITVATEAPVSIPNVVGKSRDAAESELSQAGLTPRVSLVTVQDPTQAGIVISQTPDAGTSVRRGQPVRIMVGRFNQPTTTPNGGGDPTTTPTTPATPPGDGGPQGNGNGNAFGQGNGNGRTGGAGQ